jgi:drug/metabolite transporter (DMT)-like permease
MPWQTLALLLATVSFDTVGQLSFKRAAMLPNAHSGLRYWQTLMQQPSIWLGLACYVAEFLLWLAFLSLVPLSQGVLLVSLNVVTVMLAGRWFFQETLTPWRVAGMLLVASGVAVVGAF